MTVINGTNLHNNGLLYWLGGAGVLPHVATTACTLYGWVKIADAVNDHAIFNINANTAGGTTQDSPALDGILRFSGNFCDSWNDTNLSPQPASATAWTFFALVFDGSGGAKIYYTQTVGGTPTLGLTFSCQNFSERQITIGNDRWTDYCNADFEYVGFTLNAMSSAQIAAQSNSRTPLLTAFAFWPLEGASLADISGNSRTLISAGQAAVSATSGPDIAAASSAIAATNTASVATAANVKGAGAVASTNTASVATSGNVKGAGAVASGFSAGGSASANVAAAASSAIVAATSSSVSTAVNVKGVGATVVTSTASVATAADVKGAGTVAGGTTANVATSANVKGTGAVGAGASASAQASLSFPSSLSVTGETVFPQYSAADVPTPIWRTGDPMVMQDNSSGSKGELFFITNVPGSSNFLLAKSSDNGQTYTFVTAGSPFGFGLRGGSGNGYGNMCQDSTGAVHVFAIDDAGSAYQRITLSHDGTGSINGFSAATSQFSLAITLSNSADVRAECRTIIGSSELLLISVIHDPNYGLPPGGNGHNDLKQFVILGPITITSSTQWTGLNGTAGTPSIIFDTSTDNTIEKISSHNASAHFAQNPASGDLWFIYGPIYADTWSLGTVITRKRYTRSGNTWAVSGSPIARNGVNGTTAPNQGPFMGCVTATANYVWLLHCDGNNGIQIDKIAADGTYTENAFPRFDTTINLTFQGVLSVSADETKAFVALSFYQYISSSPLTMGPRNDKLGYYNGSTWQKYDQGSPSNRDDWGNTGVHRGVNNGITTIWNDTANGGFRYASIFLIGGATAAVASVVTSSGSASATAKGAGAIAGALNGSVVSSGTLAGAGAVAGALPAAVATAGNVLGAGAIAATNPASVATLANVIGASQGAVPVSIAASCVPGASLAGAAALAASSPASVATSGGVSGSAAAVAAIPASVATSATVLGASQGSVSSAAAAACVTSSQLAGAGAVPVASSASVTMTSDTRGAGAVSAPFTSSGTESSTITGAGAVTSSNPATASETVLLSGIGSNSVVAISTSHGDEASNVTGAGAISANFSATCTLSEVLTGIKQILAAVTVAGMSGADVIGSSVGSISSAIAALVSESTIVSGAGEIRTNVAAGGSASSLIGGVTTIVAHSSGNVLLDFRITGAGEIAASSTATVSLSVRFGAKFITATAVLTILPTTKAKVTILP